MSNLDRKVVQAPGPVADPTNTAEVTIDPASGGVNVNIAGGTVVAIAPPKVTSLVTEADVTVSGGANAALPARVAGPNGIDVDGDLGNTVVVRIAADPAVSATRGRRLGPTDTVRFQVQNADEIYVQTEDGSAQKLQVSQA